MRWLRWPWVTAKDTAEANEHTKEIADVQERLDVVEERVDVIADELAVLQRNGDE